MKLDSPAFEDGGRIPDRFGAANDDVNPPLVFSNVPEEAESLILLMHDPDAEPVVGHPFDHWVAFNIPPHIAAVEEGSDMDGATMGSNDADSNRYYGPKPPDGEHKYVFELHALDIRLGLKEGATREAVEDAMEGHVLESATLKGRFSPEQY
jgi:hypothetical protein